MVSPEKILFILRLGLEIGLGSCDIHYYCFIYLIADIGQVCFLKSNLASNTIPTCFYEEVELTNL